MIPRHASLIENLLNEDLIFYNIPNRLWPGVDEKSRGQFHLFFGGRIVIGPQYPALVASVCMLLISAIFMQSRILDSFTLKFISSLLATLTGILIIMAGTMNPGIIPRRSLADIQLMGYSVNDQTGIPYSRYVTLDGKYLVRQKWCHTCNIYRPLRSKHCRHCDACIAQMDHHCTFLGGCVGGVNYRWFLLLLASVTVYSIYCFTHTLSFLKVQYDHRYTDTLDHIIHQEPDYRILLHSTDNHISNESLASFVIHNIQEIAFLVVSFVSILGIGVLSLYHILISAYGVTTNESINRYYQVNPFDDGIFKNLLKLLKPPKYDQFEVDVSYAQPAGLIRSDECLSDLYDV